MENKTDLNRGEIVDIILANDIHPAPYQGVIDQSYRIGENKAFITIHCNKNGDPLYAFCIRHENSDTKYLKFDDPKDAVFVSNACKQRLSAQINEQEKIAHFNHRFR